MRPIEMLLVEDNPGDVELMLANMREWKIRNNVTIAEDGEEALAILRQEGEFKDTPRPDIIILDLNLPKMDGRSLLKIVKSDPSLHAIPVVVMTSSGAEEDVAKSYDLHANCYVKKPVGLDQMTAIVKNIETFWLSIVTLPPR